MPCIESLQESHWTLRAPRANMNASSTSTGTAAMTEPTLVMIPCFSGSPWTLSQLEPLQHLPMRTMRLPDELDDLERLADFVEQEVEDLDSYILVGDSFGAVIAL